MLFAKTASASENQLPDTEAGKGVFRIASNLTAKFNLTLTFWKMYR